MNFIKAVQALKDEQCDGIQREGDKRLFAERNWFKAMKTMQVHVDEILATDWELVDIKPQTETVEVVRWVCVNKEGVYDGTLYDTESDAQNSKISDEQVVEAKYSYQKPILRKVKRREEISSIDYFKTINPKILDAKFFAEWKTEEK